jgi:hypothetical protein
LRTSNCSCTRILARISQGLWHTRIPKPTTAPGISCSTPPVSHNDALVGASRISELGQKSMYRVSVYCDGLVREWAATREWVQEEVGFACVHFLEGNSTVICLYINF